jgi:hypothetical protein
MVGRMSSNTVLVSSAPMTTSHIERSCFKLSELELSKWDVPLEDSKWPASLDESLELEAPNDEKRDLSPSEGGYWPAKGVACASSLMSAPPPQCLDVRPRGGA